MPKLAFWSNFDQILSHEQATFVCCHHCIQRIQPLLEATYSALSEIDYEVILIEDGSTDRTVAEVKKYANERTKLLIFNHYCPTKIE